jgi:tetratricopeptide (TPR) repeat protein
MRPAGGVCLLALAAATASCASSGRTWLDADVETTSSVPLEVWRHPPVPEAAAAAYAQARRLAGLGRTADAYASVSAALDADPGFIEANRLLQDLLARTTADWWLHDRYTRRLAERPGDADSSYYLARIEPDPDRQLALFTQAVKADPLHPYATLGRAVALARRGDVRAALTLTRRAAELAPWLSLPWLWLGAESMKRGETGAALRFFGAARDRAADDPRAWIGLSDAEDALGQRERASRSALEALRLAPGDESTAAPAVETLAREGVPVDLAAALDAIAAAERDGAPRVLTSVFRGRLLAALGRSADSAQAFEEAMRSGASPEEVAEPLRLARTLEGRFRDAVLGSRAAMPPEAFAADDLYAPRWERLRAAAETNLTGARRLLELAEAMASVGWLGESRAVLVAARAAAPGDPVVAARAAEETAFAAFVEDLGRIAREARDAGRAGTARPSVSDLLARVSEASQRRLGFDAADGAVVRNYPFLGEFAVSTVSGGAFETTFGSHGLLCLVGARSGAPAELVLGRLVVVRASTREAVMGEPISCDECWIESEGLPRDAAGLSRGLAGLTLDRLVVLQLDAIRRSVRPPEAGLPFLAREAPTAADRRSLDSPSDVAARIEASVAARGRAEGATLDAVRRHELVHVYDAARLLPLTAHPFAAARFAIAHGLDGAATERALECRAQALSIAAAREPRVSLAALLAFLPAREGETPHTAAYCEAAQIAVDLVLADPASFPSIDPSFNVLQQMDRLTDDEVRELGRRLASQL